ncbi:hypothetical protein [Aurantiacibacter suaedae]|uniref:hypothetical protein n=1 Tax=Aurantiacibacter suaedae TaxID=2545755 RepID=UPI001386A7E2|nr:hypothetical protein [Aurantiacibacter suaedae]
MITAQIPGLAGLARALERQARKRALARAAERRLAAEPGEQSWRRAEWLWPAFTSEP